jgi:hypothetical protein
VVSFSLVVVNLRMSLPSSPLSLCPWFTPPWPVGP